MKIITNLFRQFLFWLLLFGFERLVFLIYYRKLIRFDGIPLPEVLSTFYYAIKLDISTASYILIWPFLLSILQYFTGFGWINRANKVYTGFVILIYLLISAGEMGLYGEWKTKLSYKALQYLEHPAEVFNSISTAEFLGLILFISLQWILFVYLYKRLVYKNIDTEKPCFNWKHAALLFSFVPMLFVGMRGGLSQIPITTSQSYFSKYNMLNLAAVNSAYNLFFSVLDYAFVGDVNVFKTMPGEKAAQYVKEIHRVEKDTTVSIVINKRPNILVIMLESWSADLIESLGGDAGITPEFRKLEQQALLFTNFYATGNRSQQAMASLYAGLPGLPVTTLTNHPEKYPSVPSLVRQLKDEGYFTSFYFGGELNYGNIKSYLISNNFDRIIEGADLDPNLPRGKLGLHDGMLFKLFANDLNSMQQPFFTTVFTLSSHAPYDQPGERPIDWISLEKEYVNAAHYTDQALGAFIADISKEAWYSNTLILVFADHSHNTYKNNPLQSFAYHKIPLLICGGALDEQYRGTQNDRLFANVDLTTTLLHQLDLAATDYPWSKDMFNPYAPEFAFFELNDGFGWKRKRGEVVMQIFDQYMFVNTAPEGLKTQFELEGKAYIQVLFEDFLNY